MTQTLGIAALVGTGLTAGVLFAVALSIVPALLAMPPDRYLYAQRLLGRNWDPTMPVIVLGSALLTLVLLALAPTGTERALFGTAALCLVAVSAISHLANVPINRQMRSIDPQQIPADWVDPRLRWRSWHLLRTSLAVLALIVNGTAVALL